MLTSRRFMERFDFKLNAELIYLEDFREQVTLADKLVAALDAYAVPVGRARALAGTAQDPARRPVHDHLHLGLHRQAQGRDAQLRQHRHERDGESKTACSLDAHDTLCGILPLFHSMGFTIGMWAVLGTGVKGAYHFSPLDAKVIGKMCKDHDITIMVTTPTFLRSYLRRCTPEEFAKLNLVVTGAEKLPGDLLEAFEAQVRRPADGRLRHDRAFAGRVGQRSAQRDNRRRQRRWRAVGTVGKPIPGRAGQDRRSRHGQGPGRRRVGHAADQRPQRHAGLFQDARARRPRSCATAGTSPATWRMIDADGFIHITGRLSRFSKIGGEMVPHIHVEELLQRIVSDDDEKVAVAVTAVPDERKGERLIVFHLPTRQDAPTRSSRSWPPPGCPICGFPRPTASFEVEQIPLLGTGKLDLQAVKELAKAKVAEVAAGKQRSGSK